MTDNTLAPALLADIRGMIEEARAAVAAAVNAGLTLLYWRIGRRINDEVLQGERAAYSREIVATLAQELTRAYGGGFAEKNLRRMMQFAEVFPDEQFVVSLIRQWSWTHIIALLPLKQPLQREFYAEMCRIERWGVRTLRRQIDSMLYERTALSKKPDELIRHELDALRATDRMTPDLIFKDPYILDFLGLRDRYYERWQQRDLLRRNQHRRRRQLRQDGARAVAVIERRKRSDPRVALR